MSFNDCIDGKVNEGSLKKEQADRIKEKYEKLRKRYAKSMGDEQAAATAAAKLIEGEQFRVEHEKFTKKQAALYQARVVEDIQNKQKGNFVKGKVNLSEQVNIRQKTVLKQALNGMDEVIEQFRAKFAGLKRDTLGVKPVIRELLGEDTGNASAKTMSKSVKGAFDMLHQRFRAAGGLIGKIDNYYPQIHSRDLIRAATFEEWRNFMLPRLDRNKMVDLDTGLPIDDDKLLRLMKDDYEDIKSDGRHSLEKAAAEGKQIPPFGSDVGMRRSTHRFYQFKNPDSFFEYNDRFGSGPDGLYDMMVNSLSAMARDVALLEVYGPKPNALARHLDLQMKAAAFKDGRPKFSKTKIDWANATYDIASGRTDSLAGESKWTPIIGATQNTLRSALLGATPLSALSDTIFLFMAAKANGLSATRMIGQYMKQMLPQNAADRQIAKRVGYMADIMGGQALADARFAGDNMTGGTTAWLANFTNTASGLRFMTEGLKNGVALEAQATVAELIRGKKAWGELNGALADALEAHGIGENEWSLLRRVKPYEPDSGKFFLDSRNIIESDLDATAKKQLADRYDDWIFTMRDLAANEPGVRTRAITTGAVFGDARRGTATRNLFSSLFMLKSFPITVMFNHLIPSFRQAQQGKFGPLVSMAVGMTLLGGLAIQAHDISKGRTPRDMGNFKFWLAAAMQGGGFGLFGDFLFSDYSRFGRDPLVDALGPMFGLGSDTLRVFKGSFDRALEDPTGFETQRFLKDLFNYSFRYAPAWGLWYTRVPLERAVKDQIERMIDPQFDTNVRRMESKIEREYGSTFFWGKGNILPEFAQ